MDEIPANSPGLRRLFDPAIPNHPILFSALDGASSAHVLVDDPSEPGMAALRTADGLVFISTAATEIFLRSALRRLQGLGPVIPVVSLPVKMFPKPDVEILRLEFKDHDPASESYRDWLNIMPDGLELVPMDSDLMSGCNWLDLIELVYGTPENFLARGFGYCLMAGDKIVTEVYAAFEGAGGTEMGVFTDEAHRGNGFGTVACAHLIREIEERGSRPYWSCDESNKASTAIAGKLGFRFEGEYTLFGYRPLVVPKTRKN